MSMDNAKIEVVQRGRKLLVYAWAMQAADEICEATIFTRMTQPETDVQIYLAELITNCVDSAP
jgi:hypothetical protein